MVLACASDGVWVRRPSSRILGISLNIPLGVMQVKMLLAVMVRKFEFKDSGVKIDKMLSPSLQPFVAGEAATLPIHISLAH